MRKYDKIMNKGFNIENFKDKGFIVQEKLDGSNASLTINTDTGKLEAFSRNRKLSENNTLNGFYDFVMNEVASKLVIDDIRYLLRNYIFYGEWLVPHKVRYKDEAYHKFYLFDLYDKELEHFLSPVEVYEVLNDIASDGFISYPQVFLSFYPEDIARLKNEEIQDSIKKVIGKSQLTLEPNTGEGIVIKSLQGKSDEEDYYKFVTDRFKETKHRKNDKPSNSDEHVVDYAITTPRLEKIIYKKIDEGELTKEDLSLQNFGRVMGAVAKDFQEDILEEEMEILLKLIRKRISRQLPNVLRPILEEMDKEKNGLN